MCKVKQLKTYQLFLLLLFLNILILWYYDNYVMTREVYHHLLSNQLETSRIDQFIDLVNRFKIWKYILAAPLLWLRITVITLLLQFPLLLKFIDVPFNKIFRWVTQATFVLTFGSFIKIIWLSQLPVEQMTQTTLAIMPGSLSNFVKIANYSSSAVTLFNQISIFEILWCLVVYRGLSCVKKIQKIDAALIVCGIWTFLCVFQWALIAYLEKMNS